ncbi:MAG: type I methionyl aminopeptidase [Steroidobacteraceae bacterium]
MIVSSDSQLRGLQRAGKLVAQTLIAMQSHARPGMSTAELDEFGGQLLTQAGANSAPRSTYDFPGHTCISVNAEAAHGIPGERVLCADDLINIDVSAEVDGYFADTGGSFVLAPNATTNSLKHRLCAAAQYARDAGIAVVRTGQSLNIIGRRIERTIHAAGFRNVRNLCGHGVGGALHEEPTMRNYYDSRDSGCLRDGQVITIEPFLSTNVSRVREASDGWTLLGRPSSLFAQFEHTVVVRQGEPLILTLP